VKVYLKWHEICRKWHCRLVDYLNIKEKREVFLKWVDDNCDSENKSDIMKEIREWKYIDEFKVRIKEEKKKPTTLLYWLCIFKDLVTARNHPKPTISKILKVRWGKIYNSPFLMNHYISQINHKVMFYLIKLTIPNYRIPIYSKYKGNWVRYKRIDGKLGPSSIPLGLH